MRCFLRRSDRVFLGSATVGKGATTHYKKDNKKKAGNGTEGEASHLQAVQEGLFAAGTVILFEKK
jgi:hypothetical protein